MPCPEAGVITSASDPLDDVWVEFDLPPNASELVECTLELDEGDFTNRIS